MGFGPRSVRITSLMVLSPHRSAGADIFQRVLRLNSNTRLRQPSPIANAHEIEPAKQLDCIGEKSEAKAVHYFSNPLLRSNLARLAGFRKLRKIQNRRRGVTCAAHELAGIRFQNDCAWPRETPLPYRPARRSCPD